MHPGRRTASPADIQASAVHSTRRISSNAGHRPFCQLRRGTERRPGRECCWRMTGSQSRFDRPHRFVGKVSDHAAFFTTTLWARSGVSLRLLRGSYAEMPLHAGDHSALSGKDQRTASGPYRYPDRSSRSTLQGIARVRNGGVFRRYARAGGTRCGNSASLWVQQCAHANTPRFDGSVGSMRRANARSKWPYGE